MMEGFSEQDFEQKLFCLKGTHDSISSLSAWCLNHDEFHEKIVSTWFTVFKRVNMEHRLLMFYLANDIIQYSKRKGLPYVDGFATALQKATTMVRDPTVRDKILRLFKIWGERNVYDESYLTDLSDLLTRGHKPVSKVDIEDFQPNVLIARLQSCKKLEDDTDTKMKILVESELPLTDVEKMKDSLRDKKASEEVYNEVDEGVKKIENFISALELEIKERIGLIDLLDIGEQYYEKEMGEAKLVVNAYKCFSGRVKSVKRKLDDIIETVPSQPATPPNPPLSMDNETLAPDSNSGGFLTGGSFFGNSEYAKEFQEFNKRKLIDEVDNGVPSNQFYSTFSSFSSQPILTAPLPLTPPPPTVTSLILPPPPPPPPLPSSNEYPSFSPVQTSYSSRTFMSQVEKLISQATPSLAVPPLSLPSQAEVSSSTNCSVPIANLANKLMPPPALPSQLQFPDSAGKCPAWNETSAMWESPESPPNYEKEGYPPSFDAPILSSDIDMRCKDIDRRNLISLTGSNDSTFLNNADSTLPNAIGSSVLGDAESSSHSTVATHLRSNNDSALRSTDAIFTEVDSSLRTDNVENVDMEMSDDEDRKPEPDSLQSNNYQLHHNTGVSSLTNIPLNGSSVEQSQDLNTRYFPSVTNVEEIPLLDSQPVEYAEEVKSPTSSNFDNPHPITTMSQSQSDGLRKVAMQLPKLFRVPPPPPPPPPPPLPMVFPKTQAEERRNGVDYWSTQQPCYSTAPTPDVSSSISTMQVTNFDVPPPRLDKPPPTFKPYGSSSSGGYDPTNSSSSFEQSQLRYNSPRYDLNSQRPPFFPRQNFFAGSPDHKPNIRPNPRSFMSRSPRFRPRFK